MKLSGFLRAPNTTYVRPVGAIAENRVSSDSAFRSRPAGKIRQFAGRSPPLPGVLSGAFKLHAFLAIGVVGGLLLARPAAAQPATGVLKPGAVLRFEFPELPKTLAGRVPGITVRLPDNYEAGKTFPLFVFLPGGTGGNGANLDRQLEIAGKKEWIVGSFPLFGKEGEGIYVGFDCYPKIKTAYEAFLRKIRETIPNVDWERSVMGGSSNGAHTIAALLSAMDAATLEHFKGFFLIDGGQDWTLSGLGRFGGAFGGRSRSGYRFLLIFAGGTPEQPKWSRKQTRNRVESFREHAEHWKIKDFEVVIYPNKEHGFHQEYHPIIAKWLAHEPLPALPGAPQQPGAPINGGENEEK